MRFYKLLIKKNCEYPRRTNNRDNEVVDKNLINTIVITKIESI